MKPLNLRQIMLLLIAASFASSVSSCNTMRGVGRDIHRTGSHIEDAAR